MSQENVETVRRVYDRLARRDWDAIWRDFDPDFVLDTQLQGSYRGRDECEGFPRGPDQCRRSPVTRSIMPTLRPEKVDKKDKLIEHR